MIFIHPSAHVSGLADLECSCKGSKLTVGGGSVVDSFVKFKPAGGLGDVCIGENTVINSGCVLYYGNGIVIGNHCAVGANCTFAPVNHEFKEGNRLIRDQGFRPSKGGIVVEDDVWIGANCIILDGSIIRRGAVVGAGSLVRSELMAYTVYYGNPVSPRGKRNF